MQTIRKPLDGTGTMIMIVMCVILGLHQVAIKAAAPDIAPIVQIALRYGLSSLLVLLTIALRKESLSLKDGTLFAGFVVGMLFSLEFLFIAEGLRYTTASHMSVFLYTSPIFTALALHWLVPSERLTVRQWLGVTLSFIGIVVSFTGGSFQIALDSRELLGDGLGILGGMAWAATTVVIRCTRLSSLPAAKTLLYQLVCGFILLSIYAVLSGQADTIVPTPLACASILFQGVVISFGTYLAWFAMLKRYHVPQLSAFMFLSPILGISFGVLLLHEKVTMQFVTGSILVLMGVTLVSLRR
ncbi:MAG: DMT family transporter [Deltaproteobacteria bacterium]